MVIFIFNISQTYMKVALLWGNAHFQALLAIGKLVPTVEEFANSHMVT